MLAAHPRVAEVAVTGTPSEEWGEVVTAWVVADGRPPTLDDLAEFCAADPGPLQAAPGGPRGGRVCPATRSGKVVRSQLGREQALGSRPVGRVLD